MQIFYILFLLLSFSSSVYSQNSTDWKDKYSTSFLKLLDSELGKPNSSASIELWTVSPGLTITTAFGHTALRIYWGKEYSENDYYVDFGVYDESPDFFWRFLKGEAKFFINIVPTESAYQTWDASGRGVVVTKLNFTSEQKARFFQSLNKTISKYKSGYYYENFTQNCVTFIRDILTETQGKRLELPYVDSSNNTWRARVTKYSNRIFWLNINETLLFDNDTDKARDSNEIIYIPNDLLSSLEFSDIKIENFQLIKERILLDDGKSGELWKILFITIILFSIPLPFLSQYSRISEFLFGFISTFSSIFTLLVFLLTSFSFMNETISWLIYSPMDFIFLKGNKFIIKNKIYNTIFKIRFVSLILIILLNIFFIHQDIYNIATLSFVFYILYIYKYKIKLFGAFNKSES